MFKLLSVSAGDSVYVDALTIGGYTLGMPGSGHLHNPGSIELIQEGIWDFVVLQEQSQMPTIPYYRDNYTFPAADSLNEIILENNQCANTVFFMTWGRKYGGQQCINGHCSPVFVDYFHMQDSLESAYMHMTFGNDAYCAPVGISWSNSITNGDPIELFAADASHPTEAGSYLAACTFYATFFNQSPVGIDYTAGLSALDALYLQQVAHYTVLTDPAQWNIYPPEPVIASYTYELQALHAEFTSTSQNASVFHWNFGDPSSGSQNTSTLENPAHDFSGPGSYIVTLTAGDSCLSDVFTDTLVVIETGVFAQSEMNIRIFPNPAGDVVFLQFGEGSGLETYYISSMEGKVFLSGNIKSINEKAQITGLSALNPGVYLLILNGKKGRLERKIIISR
ncbi:MAG: T9SS type A sorting domain-containing protein [Bacteroidales bacterium]|nr:T9SS type A sorting domain-containing protein [Bacteroidales bacterium]